MSYKSNKFRDSINKEFVWLECKGFEQINTEYFLDAFNKALAKILEVDYEMLEDEALKYNPEDINMYFDKFDSQKASKDNTVSATSYEAGTGKAKEEGDQLNKEARLGWTTSSHTAGNVPVFAVGAGSGLFAGKMDNTDIPKKICSAMGVEF